MDLAEEFVQVVFGDGEVDRHWGTVRTDCGNGGWLTQDLQKVGCKTCLVLMKRRGMDVNVDLSDLDAWITKNPEEVATMRKKIDSWDIDALRIFDRIWTVEVLPV